MSRARPTRRRRDRGVLLGIVMVLLAIVFAAGIFALWSLRSEAGSSGRDRLSRQLFDCAEQGLAYGKWYFSTGPGQQSGGINTYLAANICSVTPATGSNAGALPCWNNGGPFPNTVTGTAPTGYPITQQITMDPRQTAKADFEYSVAIYNDPAELATPGVDSNNEVIVYSRCTDLNTMQQRSVQALIQITQAATNDYRGQAGRGFRNQGNQNF